MTVNHPAQLLTAVYEVRKLNRISKVTEEIGLHLPCSGVLSMARGSKRLARTHNAQIPPVEQSKKPVLAPVLVPAAQYVRMSDEMQQYSPDNQKAAIQEYASQHGFEILKTYADLGKSGVAAKHRTGLKQLLKDVISGDAKYKAILVYDVSRWGRFPNNDEAAHYEFLCASSGIPLHYCAELFANDGTASSSLLKALKRSMAAEFSRELGDKVFRGKSRLAQLGFWVGGEAGYGFRRLMVSANGKPKHVMKRHEQKSFTTDRVILIPGPREELEGVRLMFVMAASGKGCTSIARELNQRGLTHSGRSWAHQSIQDVINNPKYLGCNVWNRHTQRLQGKKALVDSRLWVRKNLAFAPLIEPELFDRAQKNVRKATDIEWPTDQILKKLRRLLKAKGYLSEGVIQNSRGRMPALTTITQRFGGLRRLYPLLGYPAPEKIFKAEQAERSKLLRRNLFAQVTAAFPDNVAVTHLPNGKRSLFLIDEIFMVAVLLCSFKRKRGGKRYWEANPVAAEREYITLICGMNRHHDQVLEFYLLPPVHWKFHRWYPSNPTFPSASKLNPSLSDFYTTAQRLWMERSRGI